MAAARVGPGPTGSEAPETPEIPDVLSGLTADESIDPMAVVSHELHRKTTRRRVIEAAISLAVVALIFVFVLPAVTGSHYSEIWHEISKLSTAWLVGLTVVWVLGMLAYTGVLTNSLPGLTHPQALTVNFAGSAVSNVVPFGGAVGVGATYAIDLSWGFSMPTVTLSILVSGVWNVFAKLGMPVIALVLLIATGRATGHLVIPTLIGLVALVGAATVLALVMRSEALATRIGAFGQRIVTPVSRWLRRSSAPDVAAAVLEFRHSSIGLLRTRWWRLTLWVVLYNFGQFLLLLLCVRAVGEGADQLGWIEVFAAFAFARLLETIPFTPSGVGLRGDRRGGRAHRVRRQRGGERRRGVPVPRVHLPGRDPRRRRGLGRVGHQALVAPPHRLRRQARHRLSRASPADGGTTDVAIVVPSSLSIQVCVWCRSPDAAVRTSGPSDHPTAHHTAGGHQ